MTDIRATLNKIAPAVEQLACHQQQADADGVMVTVSRQAVDEVVSAINEIAISLSAAPGEPCAWVKRLADNWRGRRDSLTGDSVRDSCADELEKVAACHATPQPVAGWDIEEIAQWLHDETGHPDSYPNHTWPETERDDGQRAGAFVKIVPLHAQEYFRDIARRLVTQLDRSALRREAPAPAEGVIPSSIVTCCVTGAIPGDGGACGDCDPCIMGEASVPGQVKRLIAPSDIAGLSERLSDPRIDGAWYLRQEAKAALDSLSARVKELEAELRDWQDSSEAYRKDFEAAESRALRAKQQRDEAYERAAKVADGYCGVNFPPQYQHAEIIADAIRRLASGPEGGAKHQESKP